MENNVMNEVTNEAVKVAEDTIFGIKKADFVYCVKEGIVIGVVSVITRGVTEAATKKITNFIDNRKMKKEAVKDPKPEAETVVDGDFSEV